MLLKNRALEILDRVDLPVQVALFLEFLGNREALLGQAPMVLPVGAELAAQSFARLGELTRVRGAGLLIRGLVRIFVAVLERTQL